MSNPIFRLSLFAILILANACAARSWDNRVNAIYAAEMKASLGGNPYPVPTTVVSDFTVKQAYAVQHHYVRFLARHQHIAGYKAGLTAKPAWEKFGLTEPLAGVLFDNGRYPDGASVSAAEYRALHIETEMAFVVGQTIAAPLDSVVDLKPMIKAIAPAVELPDLGFKAPQDLRGVDVIAANASAAGYIVGERVEPTAVTPAAITTTLSRDGETLSTGQGSDAMGDPWAAALWLVNHTIAQGYTLNPGDLLLTGALGALVPGAPGSYRASFGPLGQLSFSVVP